MTEAELFHDWLMSGWDEIITFSEFKDKFAYKPKAEKKCKLVSSENYNCDGYSKSVICADYTPRRKGCALCKHYIV